MALNRTNRQFRHLAVLLGMFATTLSSACSDLDPVKVESKCDGTGVIDEHCPQCQTPRIANNCAQCQQSAPDESVCLPIDVPWTAESSLGIQSDGGSVDAESGQPSPDGTGAPDGTSGAGGSGASDPSKPNSPANAQPSSGSGGSGGGTANKPMIGGAAGEARGSENAPRSGCVGDGDCTTPGYPACRGDGKCTECTKDMHCPTGMQCNTSTNGCVECWNNDGCAAQGKVCFTEAAMCVQCNTDPDCPMSAHACTPEHTCVACTGPQHCTAEAPTCVENTCVECDADTDCTRGGKRACITEEHRCVECKLEAQCRGVSGRPHCDTSGNACVECLKDADCSDPSAAHCDLDSHSCVPCSSNTHCAAFAATAPRCAPSGDCVACDRDGGICNGKACILSTHVCSDKARQSVAACDECKSTDECIAGHVCVPTNFNSRSTGDRCLPNYADYRQAGKPCPRPYSRKVSKVQSVEALSIDTLCALPETTSCEALLDTLSKKNCGGNNLECGLGMYDGFCGMDGCTYNCTSNDFCPNSMSCSDAMRICL